MAKLHRIKNQRGIIEIFNEPPLILYRKGKSLKDLLVRAKLWRSDNFLYDQVQESCVARRQCLNLVTWDLSSLIPCFLVQVRPKESQEIQGDRSVRQIPHPPIPCHTQVKKKHKLPSHRHLPTPTTFHFLPPRYIFAPISSPSLFCTSPLCQSNRTSNLSLEWRWSEPFGRLMH